MYGAGLTQCPGCKAWVYPEHHDCAGLEHERVKKARKALRRWLGIKKN